MKASLSELAGNFRLGGTLANPSLGMDTTQSATSLDKVISGFLAGRKGASPTPPAETQADEPLCPKAMEAARKGVKMSSAVKQQKKETSVPGQTPSPGMKDLGKEFQKLFKK